MKIRYLLLALLPLIGTRLGGADAVSTAYSSRLKELVSQASRSEEAFAANELRLKALADSAPTDREKGTALVELVRIFRANTPEDWKRMKGYAEQALALKLSDAEAFSVEKTYIRILEREAVFPLPDQVRQEILRHYVRAMAIVILHPVGAKEAAIPMPYINRLHPTDPKYAEEEKKMQDGKVLQANAREHNLMLASLPSLNEGTVSLYAVTGRSVLEGDLRAINAPDAVRKHVLDLITN